MKVTLDDVTATIEAAETQAAHPQLSELLMDIVGNPDALSYATDTSSDQTQDDESVRSGLRTVRSVKCHHRRTGASTCTNMAPLYSSSSRSSHGQRHSPYVSSRMISLGSTR